MNILHPSGGDQYWSSVLHSFDPRTPSGALNLAGALYPGRITSDSVPMDLPSTVPGVRIERVIRRFGPYKNFMGDIDLKSAPGSGMPGGGLWKGTSDVGYNAFDRNNHLIGSIMGTLYPTHTYIQSVYVDPQYRNTPLFHDLVRPALQRGLPIQAAVVNEKLVGVLRRLQQSGRFPPLNQLYLPPEFEARESAD